ncbi:GNAT family N-acetyltransferase [Actinoplanes sp. NBRC 101535]|uniref:GNAT family N-acetyltransferase n=1 Tax=Actinoplanes sp. NBRC 101535 TaxID=3032196 RepID=UPI0025575733|nr:GNAT family N-acetyltransferase [Actinoplanes sp. NBRC 101535]
MIDKVDPNGAEPWFGWALAARDARVWRRPGAAVVACPGLAHWDRLAMSGEPDALAGLLRTVYTEIDGDFRPFGSEELVTAVVARMPELEVSARFAWMETTDPLGPGGTGRSAGGAERSVGGTERPAGDAERPAGDAERPTGGTGRPAGGTQRAAWLTEDAWPEVTALIERDFPESYARPGGLDVRRWAGIRDDDGTLLVVAAEAWSSAEIGFVAGVATRADARGRGLAAALCTFVTNEQLAAPDRTRVALIVDYSNVAAVSAYTRMGLKRRPVAAARRR